MEGVRGAPTGRTRTEAGRAPRRRGKGLEILELAGERCARLCKRGAPVGSARLFKRGAPEGCACLFKQGASTGTDELGARALFRARRTDEGGARGALLLPKAAGRGSRGGRSSLKSWAPEMFTPPTPEQE
jgi:hypothetical protein